MRSLIAIFLSFLFTFSLGFARKVEDWSYERLFKEADLVMIGSVEGCGSTKAQWPEKIFDKVRFEGEKTAFHPVRSLRVNLPSLAHGSFTSATKKVPPPTRTARTWSAS